MCPLCIISIALAVAGGIQVRLDQARVSADANKGTRITKAYAGACNPIITATNEYDYGVSFTPEQVERGDLAYNFGTLPAFGEDFFGLSIFVKDDGGQIFHNYSTFERGAETLLGAFNFLDFVLRGRDERSTMDWVRRHDEY